MKEKENKIESKMEALKRVKERLKARTQTLERILTDDNKDVIIRKEK